MADNRAFVDYLLELPDPLDGVTARRMFGGYGIFRHGLMFALIGDTTLYFKVDGGNRAHFEAAGSTPFIYEKNGKPMIMSYYTAPGGALDNSEEMLEWAELAWHAAERAAAKKRK